MKKTKHLWIVILFGWAIPVFGVEWTVEPLPFPGTSGFSDIAADSAGNPHICSSFAVGGNEFRYTRWNGTSWTSGQIDDQSNVCKIRVKDLNDVHFAYSIQNGGIKYAKWDGVSFTTMTVHAAAAFQSSRILGLAVDNIGVVHLAYVRSGSGLIYGVWDNVSWSTSTVDASANLDFGSFALDSFGRPHISYSTDSPEVLKQARWTGVSWSTETVDTGAVGSFSSMAIDGANNTHISYYARATGDLKYARWNGVAWSTSTVQSENDVGMTSSLAIGPSGRPSISYFVEDGGTIFETRVAMWTGSAWDVSTVVDWGPPSALTIDSLGRHHVSISGYYGRASSLILEPASSSQVSGVAYPNPLRPGRPGHDLMTLSGFSAGATVGIFTLQGEFVRELPANDSGAASWDVRNTAGEPVASGIYLVRVEGVKRMKVAVQR